jgi:hypothetical protein
MARELHRHAARDASPLKVPHRRSPEVARNAADHFSRLARVRPGLPKVLDQLVRFDAEREHPLERGELTIDLGDATASSRLSENARPCRRDEERAILSARRLRAGGAHLARDPKHT